jgi:hypothetical protein
VAAPGRVRRARSGWQARRRPEEPGSPGSGRQQGCLLWAIAEMASRPSRQQYSRVAGDAGVASGADESSRVARRKRRSLLAELYATRLHAALWVAGAGAGAYWSDLWNVVRSDANVSRVWLNAGLTLFVVSAALVLYMALWVPRVLKVDLDPAVYSPWMLPVTAAISCLCGLCLIVGLWPVYGLLTPALLGLLWVGSLMSAHFLPAF